MLLLSCYIYGRFTGSQASPPKILIPTNPLFPLLTNLRLELHPIIWRLSFLLRVFEILKSDNDIVGCTTSRRKVNLTLRQLRQRRRINSA